MSNGVDAWSYSRWKLYDECPFAFKCKNIDKIREEQGAAAARGDVIHKAAETYVTADADGVPPPPPELAKFASLFVQLRQLPKNIVMCEQQWGFTRTWRATGYFTKQPPVQRTWLRVKLDVGVIYPDGTADVIDHKTGKAYDDHADQMELNSLVMICRYPQVHEVTNRLWYIDTGSEIVNTFTSDQRAETIAKWEERVAPMFADTMFAPRPSNRCQRCSYSRSNSGPCRFG